MKTNLGTEDVFKYYESIGGTASYPLFSRICGIFNKKVMELILEGYYLDMKSYMSRIGIIKIKRTFAKNRGINWNESMKYKEELESKGIPTYDKENCPEGKKWFVYFIDQPFYFR